MAIPSASIADSTPQPQLGTFARIVGIFFNPKETFKDIVAAPTWIVPTILLVVLGTAACFALNQRMDWRSYMAQQIEKSPQAANLSPDQKEQRVETGAKFSKGITYFLGIVPLVLILLVALAMWGAYYLLAGIGASFSQVMGIVSHVYLTSILSTAIFLLVLFIKPVGSFDLDNPVATNLGVLVPEDAPKWLLSLGKSIDIFSFWMLILIAIGFAAVNPRKLKFGQSFAIVLGVWAVYVLCKVGAAWIFS